MQEVVLDIVEVAPLEAVVDKVKGVPAVLAVTSSSPMVLPSATVTPKVEYDAAVVIAVIIFPRSVCAVSAAAAVTEKLVPLMVTW